MKVLLSIRPNYVEKILYGNKKYEFRRKIWKEDIKDVLVYSGRPIQRITMRFKVENIYPGTPQLLWERYNEYSGMSREEFFKYFHNCKTGYAIQIGMMRELNELLVGMHPPQSFRYLNIPDLEELILLLLSTGHVSGKIMMQQQVFLAGLQIFHIQSDDEFHYHPAKDGILYSKEVEEAVDKLKTEGKIIRINRGEGHATYILSEVGKIEAEKIEEHINKDKMEYLENSHIDWNEWNTEGILKYMGRNYCANEYW